MMDFVLEAWVSSIIEGKKIQWMMGKREPWQPGEKLKLLFAGYNGTRNTGSDVRVEEMLRQIRRIEIRECAGDDDDRVAGHRGGGEQAFDRLRRRGGTHGSGGRENVRALLQEFAGDHAQ